MTAHETRLNAVDSVRVTSMQVVDDECLALSIHVWADDEPTGSHIEAIIAEAVRVVGAGLKFEMTFGNGKMSCIEALWLAFEFRRVDRYLDMTDEHRFRFTVQRSLSPCSIVEKGKPVRRRGASCV